MFTKNALDSPLDMQTLLSHWFLTGYYENSHHDLHFTTHRIWNKMVQLTVMPLSLGRHDEFPNKTSGNNCLILQNLPSANVKFTKCVCIYKSTRIHQLDVYLFSKKCKWNYSSGNIYSLFISKLLRQSFYNMQRKVLYLNAGSFQILKAALGNSLCKNTSVPGETL